MKATVPTLLLAVPLAFGLCATATFAATSVSVGVQINAVNDFHTPLASHGTWVEVGSYGRCWRPSGIAVGWRPYSYGNWVWTDLGWYWESDEPWGWACYHYGNWVNDGPYGWVWVPGIEWSPAWVSWRTGGGYWGWAPLPPRSVVIAPTAFVFVESRRFHDHIRPNTIIVNNTTIINQTTEIKNVRREVRNAKDAPAPNVVVNAGPQREAVEKATGSKVRTMAMRDVTQRERREVEQARRSAPNRNAQPAPERAPAPVTPAAPATAAPQPLKDKDTPFKPEQPTPPERPAPPDKPARPETPVPPTLPKPPTPPDPPAKPTPPEKPFVPERPAPPAQPVPPERPGPSRNPPPAEINPAPAQLAPTQPSERGSRRYRGQDSSHGRSHRPQ